MDFQFGNHSKVAFILGSLDLVHRWRLPKHQLGRECQTLAASGLGRSQLTGVWRVLHQDPIPPSSKASPRNLVLQLIFPLPTATDGIARSLVQASPCQSERQPVVSVLSSNRLPTVYGSEQTSAPLNHAAPKAENQPSSSSSMFIQDSFTRLFDN